MMRFKYILFSIGISLIFIVSGCSSSDEVYDKAMDRGLKALKEENYAAAVSSFEEAIEEKQEDEKATSYLEQSQLLLDARKAMDEEKYSEALARLEEINQRDDEALYIVKEKAERLAEESTKLKMEEVYEKEINEIRSLFAKGEYDLAETKLATVQNLLEGNPAYRQQLARLSSLIEIGQEEEEVVKEEGVKEKNNSASGFVYRTYSNSRFGFSVNYPKSFEAGPEPTNGDGRSFSNGECTIMASGAHMNVVETNETIETYYMRELEYIESTAYQTISDDFYVISYIERDRIIYQKGIAKDGIITTLTIEYPQSLSSKYESMVTEVSNSFKGGRSD